MLVLFLEPAGLPHFLTTTRRKGVNLTKKGVNLNFSFKNLSWNFWVNLILVCEVSIKEFSKIKMGGGGEVGL